MKFVYDLYQKLQRTDEGVNIAEGKITTSLEVTPRRRKKVFVPEGPLLLPELYAHPDCKPLKEGWVPIGLLKNGGLAQSTWQGMTTGVTTGLRNFGKSGILKALTLHALRAKQQGFNCRVMLGDPHHNLPDASGTFFKPVLHQFDQTFLGMDIVTEGAYMPFLEHLNSRVEQMQRQGFDESAPWYIIIIDEADLFFKAKKWGKRAYEIVEKLINLRKARIFFLFSFADVTKSGSGGHGTGIVAAGSTVFCVRYNVNKARSVLQGPGEAQKTVSLPLGYAAVKIPARNPGEEAKVQICKMPLVKESDLDPFR